MTVKELMEKLQELIEQGYEDKIVVVDDMYCGEEIKEVYIFEDEAVLTF